MASLIAELQRRNVIRMAGLYLVVAWLIVQVVNTLLPIFEAPAWVSKTVVALLAIGFVLALVFSWVYELTPEGLKRESEIPAGTSITPHTGRRMDRLIVAGLVIAVAVVAADRLWPEGEPPATAVRPDPAQPASVPAAAPTSGDAGGALPIAVLPFLNLSGDPQQEFFSDGVTEEILNVLAGIEGLRLTSRTSSFHFKGKDLPLPQIARELGVKYVLEGSVRMAASQVRVTAQLIEVEGDKHLWSESYTRELDNIFAVQEDIARSVATELKARLSPADESRLKQAGTRDVEAYQAFLRGRHAFNQRTWAQLLVAAGEYRVALAREPDYADAWAGLAQIYALMPEYVLFAPGEKPPVADPAHEAMVAAARALEVDPTSSAALTARAYTRVMSRFEWEAAEADYRAAIASDPANATAHQWYGELLGYQRRHDEAAAQYREALAADPLAPIVRLSAATIRLAGGEYEAAIALLDEALRLHPGFHMARQFKIECLVELGRLDEADALVADLPEPDRGMYQAVLAARRDPAKADAAGRVVLAHSQPAVTGRPLLLARLGRFDDALDALERQFAAGDPHAAMLYMFRVYDPLAADPRFQALLRRIGLPRPAGTEAATP